MLPVVLSIGAIYAFIPIVIIIILIAAAVGLTRGRDLFAVFGIGALMGIKGATATGGSGRGLKTGLNVPKGTLKAAKSTGGLGKGIGKGVSKSAKKGPEGPEAAHVEALAASGRDAQLRGIKPTAAQAAAMAAMATVAGTATGMAYSESNRVKLVESEQIRGPSKAELKAAWRAGSRVGAPFRAVRLITGRRVGPSRMIAPRIARRTTADRKIGEIQSKSTDRYGEPRFRISIPIVGLAAAGAARLYDRMPSKREAAAQRRAYEESLGAHMESEKKPKSDRDKMLVEEFIKQMQSSGQKIPGKNALAMITLHGKVSEERMRHFGKRGTPPPPPPS